MRSLRRPGRRAARLAGDARFDEGRVATPLLELIDDEELARLNDLLPWSCFTVDADGRAFGRPAWAGKRTEPQRIPDPRIVELHKRFDLSGKHVLEVGCFEGVHTIALCQLASAVTAVDARVENVVKTVVRCAFFDQHPRVLVVNLEDEQPRPELLAADVCHHVGVLYHLSDPVRHLRQLGDLISDGIMLDTHYAPTSEAVETYEVDGHRFNYMRYRESGRDVFSGMRDHAKWLPLETIEQLLSESGFTNVDVAERRDERNGLRALIYARRP